LENLEKIKYCPFGSCIGYMLLKKEKRTVNKNNGEFLTGDWLFYECENCGERFTTTESDEISLNKLKKTNR